MAQHKWHKEIKAWADGAEIEERWISQNTEEDEWREAQTSPMWDCDGLEFRIKPQKTEPLIIPEEPVAVVYSMQDGYVGQMIKKGLPHKTLLYAHQDKPQPKEPQYLYVFKGFTNELKVSEKLHQFEYQGMYLGKIKLEE